MTLTVWQFALAIGLPSAFTGGLVGLFFWRLQRKIEKRDAEAAAEAARREEREAQREEPAKKNELNTIRAIGDLSRSGKRQPAPFSAFQTRIVTAICTPRSIMPSA